MGRSRCLAGLLVCLMLFLAGCGNKGAVNTTTFPVPNSIAISPAPDLSLEQGTDQVFTATVFGASQQALTEPVIYQSSNTAVLTVASNGAACAGSWDSLANPTVCTPGPVGVAEVIATAQGVSSPATRVYVHQHIDKVVASRFLLPNEPPPTAPCSSVGQTAHYKATAYSRGQDITSTVGIFTWQAVNISVATLAVAAHDGNGLLAGQLTAKAAVPGVTPLFASIGATNSSPVNFTTCAVQSIQLAVNGNSSNTIISSAGGVAAATATVLDITGTTIPASSLTWSTSEPGSVTVSEGSLTASASGTATIIASCTPPTCNVGFLPSLPVYPENVVTMQVIPTSSTPNATVYVSSTGCRKVDGCVSTMVPITVSTTNTVGSQITLPATPNSLVFSAKGDKGYLGTDSGLLGAAGLMVLNTGSTTSPQQFPSAPGKVLAVSPDGSLVIVSDTADTPAQVYVFNTTRNFATPLYISGATAASFSPDSLKAYIVAGSILYLYSQLDHLQTIPLPAPAHDVSFLAEGAFAYLAGGSASGVMVRRTCDNGLADNVTTPGTPGFIRTSPDGKTMVALDPPTLDVITADATPVGCSPPISDSVTSINLGRGDFTARQLILSEDGSAAYIIAVGSSQVFVFNIPSAIAGGIALAGDAIPVQASLTPDGTLLFVAASDGLVHVLDTGALRDVQQISFPQNFCLNSAGQPESFTCKPDLIAVKP